MNEALQLDLRRHPFFQTMKPEHVATIAGSATLVEFKPEQILFHQSEPANRFYLVLSGRIALEAHRPADGTVLVETLGPEDVLGWSWLFPPFAWHFQARVLEPTTVIALDGAQLMIAAENNHDFGFELMKRVAQVVIHRLQATRDQLFRNESLMVR